MSEHGMQGGLETAQVHDDNKEFHDDSKVVHDNSQDTVSGKEEILLKPKDIHDDAVHDQAGGTQDLTTQSNNQGQLSHPNDGQQTHPDERQLIHRVEGSASGVAEKYDGSQTALQPDQGGARPKRSQKQTERGREYTLERSVSEFKNKVKSLRSKMTKCSTLLIDNADVKKLNQQRYTLEQALGDVTDSFHAMVKIDETLYDAHIDVVRDCQGNVYRTMGEITQVIRLNEYEKTSKASRESHNKRDRRSCHGSSHCSHSSKSSSHGSSSRHSKSSIASMKAEAAAKAAAIRTKLKYVDVESEQKARLEKLQALRDLEVEEAKLEAMNEAESPCQGENFRRGECLSSYNVNRMLNPVGNAQTSASQAHVFNKGSNGVTHRSGVVKPTEVLEETCDSANTGEGASNHPVLESVQKGSKLDHNAPVFQPKVQGESSVSFKTSVAQMSQNGANLVDSEQMGTMLKTFAEFINASRLPVPEPGVFTGDPLLYPSWKCAFSTLIEGRNVPSHERVHYLRRYLGGRAKECVESFLLIPSGESYHEAIALLEKRFGDAFSVAQAFKTKIDGWPRVGACDAEGLRKFGDFLRQVEVAARANPNLRVLDDDVQNKSILMKLPDWLVTRWGRESYRVRSATQCYPSFAEFVSFVVKEADIVCDPVMALSVVHQPSEKSVKTCNAITTDVCFYCGKANHALENCFKLKARPKEEKSTFIREKGLCFGCLCRGHISKHCESRLQCSECKKPHPTVLHNESSKTRVEGKQVDGTSGKSGTVGEGNDTEKTSPATKGVSLFANHPSCQSSTMIVPVYVSRTNQSEEVLTYALLDTQSDTSFISKDLCGQLGVSGADTTLLLSTMSAEGKVLRSKRIEGLQARSSADSDVFVDLPSLFMHDRIPANRSCIPTPDIAERWPYLQPVAKFLMPKNECEIGLLIGFNCPRALAPREIIPPEGRGPFAQRTDLGWGIIGSVCNEGNESCTHAVGVRIVLRTSAKELINPNDVVQFIGDDELYLQGKNFSQDDVKFLSIMQNGIHKTEGGHYELPLPLRDPAGVPGNNREVAHERLKGLVKRFKRDPVYYEQYVTFMENMLSKGYAEKVPEEELSPDVPAHYLPHHGVCHPAKPGKVRVVMDASSKFRGRSLNDHLLTGPDLLNGLVGVLCRFRQEHIAFMCDIEGMYYQFRVNVEHRNLFRFLWFADHDYSRETVVLRSTVHLFGAASSPAVANFALKKAASDLSEKYDPGVTDFFHRNFYVDDGLKSVSSESEAISLIQQSRELCKESGLHLHKFVCNSRQVLQTVPQEDQATALSKLDLSCDPLPIERALGVQWCVESDSLNFRICVSDKPFTRRGVLSTVCSMFDPLGLIAPVVLQGKQILQFLCKSKLGWDVAIPDKVKRQWEQWLQALPILESMNVKRCFKSLSCSDVVHSELHTFADASTTGYGTCAYLRLFDGEGRITCSLVMAKARVAPLKAITVPRLELTAGVVAAEVSQLLSRELEYPDLQRFYWTDSLIVLGFIANDAKRFHVYVANRVQQIRNVSSPSQWRHVSTDQNPADLASRGCSGEQLSKSRWLVGPEFLWTETPLDNGHEEFDLSDESPEIKKATCHAIEASVENPWPVKFSSWNKLKRVTALCIRFVESLKAKTLCPLAVDDLVAAERVLIRQAQRDGFTDDLQLLSAAGRQVRRKSALSKLDPFLDKEGIIRVGGRLKHSDLPYDVMHPVVLPKGHLYTSMIVQYCHEKIAHQGKGLTINEVRAHGYWVIGLGGLVGSLIYKCVVCRKVRSSPLGQKMNDLPPDRLDDSPVFTHVAADCFGPFYVQERRKEIKRYGIIFTCLASRAVHVESLNSLDADSFINALRRFISLRGPIRTLRSDRGTNLVGGMRQLSESLNENDDVKVKEYLLQNSCDYVTNFPHASHQGGVWERQIRSVRNALNSLLSLEGHQLDDEGLRTLLHEAANIVNSRPLTIDSLNDPTALQPITPNHLLTMKSSVVLSPGTFEGADKFSRKRWRRVQYLANAFWERWRKEFLTQLQSRSKWSITKRNLCVGDVVIVKDDDIPRSQWPLGRISHVYPSADGLVRKVTVQLGDPTLSKKGVRTKQFKLVDRPIHKVVLLLENEQ